MLGAQRRDLLGVDSPLWRGASAERGVRIHPPSRKDRVGNDLGKRKERRVNDSRVGRRTTLFPWVGSVPEVSSCRGFLVRFYDDARIRGMASASERASPRSHTIGSCTLLQRATVVLSQTRIQITSCKVSSHFSVFCPLGRGPEPSAKESWRLPVVTRPGVALNESVAGGACSVPKLRCGVVGTCPRCVGKPREAGGGFEWYMIFFSSPKDSVRFAASALDRIGGKR